MEIQQKDNETLTACILHFKTAAKRCAFNKDTVAIHIFAKGLLHLKYVKMTPKLWLKSSELL